MKIGNSIRIMDRCYSLCLDTCAHEKIERCELKGTALSLPLHETVYNASALKLMTDIRDNIQMNIYFGLHKK